MKRYKRYELTAYVLVGFLFALALIIIVYLEKGPK